MSPPDDVRLRDLARGVLDTLPDLLTINRGLWNLIRFGTETRASIGQRVADLAAAHPARIALRFEDQAWSYGEFNAWANRLAAALRKAGVKPGDAVAVLMHNRAETLAVVTAVVKLGAVAAMLNHNQRSQVLAHSLQLSKPVLLVLGEECRDAHDSLGAAVSTSLSVAWCGRGKPPSGMLDLARAAAKATSLNPPETAAIQLKQPAFHIFTSGTTGLPKASVMTHYRWLRGMAGLGQMTMRLHADDVLYCALPLYHNNALTVSWGAVLGAGATLALDAKFSASKFWDRIRHYEATAFCYIGELCRYLLNQAPGPGDRQHRVRLVVGNGLRPEIWDAFQSRFGIERVSEFYGASESNLAFANGFGLAKTAGFCPLPYAIVAFDAEREEPLREGPKRFMRRVHHGTGLLITEITERTPFDGYTEKKANEGKLLRDVFNRGDCWFNTGDLVRDQGWRHIQFVDRVGDTFRWKGENVATTEVEAALNAIAGIEQAVVYGVQIPGCDGRAGMASLSWHGGRFDGTRVATALRERLPPYAVPLFLRLRKEQEVTATFKYRKVDLKREGFDPAQVADPLYLLGASRYVRLTAAQHQHIVDGRLRF